MDIQNMTSNYAFMQQYPMTTPAQYTLPDCSISNNSIMQPPYHMTPSEEPGEMWNSSIHPFHENINWSSYGYANPAGKCPPMSAHAYAIARRNERERNRVRHINSTFENLRRSLPHHGRKRKLSKVDTLRTAIKYIDHLQQILESTENKTNSKNTAYETSRLHISEVPTCNNNNNDFIKTEKLSSPEPVCENNNQVDRLSPVSRDCGLNTPNTPHSPDFNNEHSQQQNSHNFSSCSINEDRLIGLNCEHLIEDNSSQSSEFSDHSNGTAQYSFNYGDGPLACRTKGDTRSQLVGRDQRENSITSVFITDL